MVLRLILRYLIHNEQLINRLAESYPIQRAAKLVVYFFTRSRSIVEKKIDPSKLKEINLDQVKEFGKKIEENLKRIRDDVEKQAKK